MPYGEPADPQPTLIIPGLWRVLWHSHLSALFPSPMPLTFVQADARGEPCGKQTVGLPQRRHVRIDRLIPIGKESNNLEEVEAGLVHSAENAHTVYPDPRRDEWQTKILPGLKKIPLPLLVKLSGMSRSALIEIRAGRSRAHRKNQTLLESIAQEIGKL
jgi:hypothetical protein